MACIELDSLVQRAQHGDHAAFEALVKRYSGYVWSLCISYVGDTSTCEDLVQESFVKCYLQLRSLRKREAFGRWLAQIARSVSLNYLRTETRRRDALSTWHTREATRLESSLHRSPSMGEHWEQLHVLELVDALPAKTREAMNLYYVKGCTTIEGAAFLGVSEVTFRKRLSFGRKALREHYETVLTEAMKTRRPEPQHDKRIMAVIPLGIRFDAGTAEYGARNRPRIESISSHRSWRWLVWRSPLIGLVAVILWLGKGGEASKNSYVVQDAKPVAKHTPVARHQPASGASVDAPESPTVTTADAASEPARSGSISGQVFAAGTTTPIAGVEIAAYLTNTGGFCRPVMTTTDNAGRYTLAGLVPGTYDVRRGDIGGYPTAVRDERKIAIVEPDGTLKSIDFAIPEGLPVRGRVVDARGVGVADAAITYMAEQDRWFRNASAGPGGEFTIVPPANGGLLHVVATSADAASEVVGPIVLADAAAEGLIIHVEPFATIEGKVVDARGAPAANVRVQVVPNQKTPFRSKRSQHVQTDDAGRFAISAVVPGIVGLHTSRSASVHAGEPVSEIECAPGQRLRGIILTCATGHAGGEVGDVKKPSIAAEASTRRGEIKGTVVDAQTRDPLTSFEILREYTARINLSNEFLPIHAADGSFRFQDVEAGDHRLLVRAPGYAMAEARVDAFKVGERREEMVIALSPDGSVEGVVRFVNVPLAGARVYRLPLRPGIRPVITDEAGHFEIGYLPEGPVALRAEYGGADGGDALWADVNVDVYAGHVSECDVDIAPDDSSGVNSAPPDDSDGSAGFAQLF